MSTAPGSYQLTISTDQTNYLANMPPAHAASAVKAFVDGQDLHLVDWDGEKYYWPWAEVRSVTVTRR